MIHNHGPEEGAGLSCNELRLPDGSIRGACLMHIRAYAKVDDGTAMEEKDCPAIAKRWVKEHIDSHYGAASELPAYELYVVLFAYILGNWKATVSTDMPDGKYYEVTYNAAKREAYLDEYVKVVNVQIDVT